MSNTLFSYFTAYPIPIATYIIFMIQKTMCEHHKQISDSFHYEISDY